MTLLNPADRDHTVGTCRVAGPGQVDEAIAGACAAQPAWDRIPAGRRAEILEKAADLYEQHRPELLSLCICEAGGAVEMFPPCPARSRLASAGAAR